MKQMRLSGKVFTRVNQKPGYICYKFTYLQHLGINIRLVADFK